MRVGQGWGGGVYPADEGDYSSPSTMAAPHPWQEDAPLPRQEGWITQHSKITAHPSTPAALRISPSLSLSPRRSCQGCARPLQAVWAALARRIAGGCRSIRSAAGRRCGVTTGVCVGRRS